MHEFSLIEKYFTWANPPSDVAVAVGDDAAVLNIPKHTQLVTSVDTFIAGVHFPENTPPEAIGHKALAVNLSDLAAMGATPKWFTLALTMPEIDDAWLGDFSLGLKKIADQFDCFLIGGDTTRGNLSITIQVMGVIEQGKALLRSGAKAGDRLYLTGTIGDAAVGLATLLDNFSLAAEDKHYCQKRLNYPSPRLAQSQIIKRYATACMDVSDGLSQDLSHIINASNVGASIDFSKLPLSPSLQSLNHQDAVNYALTGGDDYELLFTIPADKEDAFLKEMKQKVTCVGIINDDFGNIRDQDQNQLSGTGYNHFNGK